MNTVNSYFTTNPYDKTDECAQFIIDDLTKTFVFNDVMAIGQEYTFSFWVKADAEGTIIVKGETIAVSTGWKQHTVTFVAAAADLYLVFRTVGTYYLYHPQLEKGNKATDWVQAPEDDASVIDSLRQEITSSYTRATQTATEIVLEAVKEYVKTSDLDAFRETIRTEFSQNFEGFEMAFEEIRENVSDLETSTSKEFTEIRKYIRFIGGKIILGEEGNQIVLTIQNDRISFSQNGIEVCYISNAKMGIREVEITERANIVGINVYKTGDIIYIN